MRTAKAQINLRFHAHSRSLIKGRRCPQTESWDTLKCFNREQMSRWDFAHVQDDVNQHILRMLEGTFSLDAEPTIWPIYCASWTKESMNIVYVNVNPYIHHSNKFSIGSIYVGNSNPQLKGISKSLRLALWVKFSADDTLKYFFLFFS